MQVLSQAIVFAHEMVEVGPTTQVAAEYVLVYTYLSLVSQNHILQNVFYTNNCLPTFKVDHPTHPKTLSASEGLGKLKAKHSSCSQRFPTCFDATHRTIDRCW